jgi:fimbrial chaperone protein
LCGIAVRIDNFLCVFQRRRKSMKYSLSGICSAAIIAMFLFTATDSDAMTVSPIVIDLTTTGSEKQADITVANDNTQPLPVEVAISRVDIPQEGDMRYTPAEREFIILPPQAIIPPGGSKNIHIQWIGDPASTRSLTYFLTVNQVPVELRPDESGVRMVYTFGCVINVDPPQGSSAVELVNTSVAVDSAGKKHPAIVVKNPGNAHAKLTDATIRLTSGSWTRTLTPDQMRLSMGMGLVQPGKARRFLIPVDLPAGTNSFTANIDYRPQKR